MTPKVETFGTMLRELRELNGLSVGGMARHLGIRYQRVSAIEAGRSPVMHHEAAKWAKALGQPEDRFVRLALAPLVDT